MAQNCTLIYMTNTPSWATTIIIITSKEGASVVWGKTSRGSSPFWVYVCMCLWLISVCSAVCWLYRNPEWVIKTLWVKSSVMVVTHFQSIDIEGHYGCTINWNIIKITIWLSATSKLWALVTCTNAWMTKIWSCEQSSMVVFSRYILNYFAATLKS